MSEWQLIINSSSYIDIEDFLQKKHKYKRHCLDISIFDQRQQNDYETSINDNGIISDTVEVTGEGLDNIDALECYFEGETSGGGKEKEVEAIKNIADGIVHVKFASVEGNLNTCIAIIKYYDFRC